MRERRLNTKEVQTTTWGTTADFLDSPDIPQGYLVVRDNGVPIDLFYKSNNSNTLIVCFHGAAPENVRLPLHVGATVVNYAGANRLSISDPSLHLFADAQNAWFIGSARQPNLQDTLEVLIRKIIQATGVQHVIFFGGSSGGFAALTLSHRFPGSLALPMNPQTDLARHHSGVQKYLETGWPGVSSADELPERVVTDLVSVYAAGHENTVGYIQNRRDHFHIPAHQEPFFERVAPQGGLLSMWGAWGSEGDNGHTIPPREMISKILAEAVASGGRWDEALEVFGFTPTAHAV